MYRNAWRIGGRGGNNRDITETGGGVSRRRRRLVRLVGLVRERRKNNVLARYCEPSACQRVYTVMRDGVPGELPAREKFMKKFLPPGGTSATRRYLETASRPTATNYLSLTVRISHREAVVRFSTASRSRFHRD